MRISTVVGAAAIATMIGMATAQAASGGAEASSRLAYSVSLAGLPIAEADLALADGRGRYDLKLDWHTTGLAELFAGAHGAVAASGRDGGGRPSPEFYRLTGTSGHMRLLVALAMSAGRVRSATTEPQTQPSGDLVPLGAEHRRGVLDPLSATLAHGGDDGAGLCDRTVPIFDGWSRYDIRLTPKTTRSTVPSGFAGPVTVCAVRWVPIAGHRTEHRGVRYMTANTDMEIAFARLEGRDLWLPVDVRVATMIGPARATLETATVAAAPRLGKRSRMRP